MAEEDRSIYKPPVARVTPEPCLSLVATGLKVSTTPVAPVLCLEIQTYALAAIDTEIVRVARRGHASCARAPSAGR